MESSVGARLRAHRERQNISLSAISAETKIKLFMLEGLERDDVSQWPDGIYRRAYVRAYARAVGLDPETLVREFLEAHPDPIVAPPPAAETELESPYWPADFRRLVTSALGVVPARWQRVERGSSESLHASANGPRGIAEPTLPLELRPESAAPEPAPVAGNISKGSAGYPQPLDLQQAAALCARLGRVFGHGEITAILEDAARALGAVGVIVWSRGASNGLRPAYWWGYDDDLVARMPTVRADADNGIAAAFRSGDVQIVASGGDSTGAVIVPVASHGERAGVLAVELGSGDEQREEVRAFTTILAATFVPLLRPAPLAEAVNA
jgi:hypothetical protein